MHLKVGDVIKTTLKMSKIVFMKIKTAKESKHVIMGFGSLKSLILICVLIKEKNSNVLDKTMIKNLIVNYLVLEDVMENNVTKL